MEITAKQLKEFIRDAAPPGAFDNLSPEKSEQIDNHINDMLKKVNGSAVQVGSDKGRGV
jgi:hypothetical protein